MDIFAARAALAGLTREAFGEVVTIRPTKTGKMSEVSDPDRPVMVDIPARFDLASAIEQAGGGRSRPESIMATGETATLSIERAKLLWPLQQGDQIVRVDPITQEVETYRISRFGEAYHAVVLVFLSRV